ncbi:MAG: phosphotransferase [Dehalococcoidales bacterium]|jgi:thiamine kinase-like enzyme
MYSAQKTNVRPAALKLELSRLLGQSVASMRRISGGRNSQVYRLTCEGAGVYTAKLYFRHSSEDRDRLEAEFSGLHFLWENGIRCIPRPIAANRSGGMAIYEYISGRKIPSAKITDADIDRSVDFLGKLRQLSLIENSRSLSMAAEAYFTTREVVDSVSRRLDRLLTLQNMEAPYRELSAFLKNDFVPSFKEITDWCKDNLHDTGMSYDTELPFNERTLSPSDFGFHNALKRPGGDIVFLDFEYFGWDDPAKMTADFLLHPGMELGETLKQRFLAGILTHFKDIRFLDKRVGIAYPLFGLKWCLILLNEFVPEFLMRRGFAVKQTIDKDKLQTAQLVKSRRMLATVMNEYGHFPYHT